jgi:HSP20 family protein
MPNVTRYNVNTLDTVFDDLMRGFFVRPVNFNAENGTPAQFRIDVSENEKGYVVRAEIPGVKKDDIHVSIEGNQIEISAEVKNEKDIKENEKVLRSERHYGKVYRVFTLAHEVDENATHAKYADGVLELTLPKKPSTAGKRITIQ